MNKIFQFTMLLSSFFFAAHALEPAAKFDWSTVLQIPPGTEYKEGNQILHFKSKNKHYTENNQANDFVKNFLSDSEPLQSDAEVLKAGSDAVVLDGAYLEMGVCTGKTINFIAALNPHKKIYGFDSFKGLPEDWARPDVNISQGTFGFKDSSIVPAVLHNVVLYKGWFSETLPAFKQTILKDTPIAFLHIDSDIYSAAQDIFTALGDNIVPGTILVFDEFYNYPECENHEIKALNEFLLTHNLAVTYLAFNIYHEQVAVKIVKK